jgi:hypothetical protein
VTLPVFTGPSGLPVGIQLIGHRNQDHRLLEGRAGCLPGFLTIDVTPAFRIVDAVDQLTTSLETRGQFQTTELFLQGSTHEF